MTVQLLRYKLTDQVTRGVLSLPGLDVCLRTIERPWLGNAANISCIPVGEYQCVIRQSPRFGKTYHIQAVRGRSYILIHAGNLPSHTHGCILVGMKSGHLNGQPAIFQSRKALRLLMNHMDDAEFTLSVKEAA